MPHPVLVLSKSVAYLTDTWHTCAADVIYQATGPELEACLLAPFTGMPLIEAAPVRL